VLASGCAGSMNRRIFSVDAARGSPMVRSLNIPTLNRRRRPAGCGGNICRRVTDLAFPGTLPVLLYEEEGLVHAHAVELDLMTTGATEAKALEWLAHIVLSQFAAAKRYEDPSHVPLSTEPDIRRRYETARARLLLGLSSEGDRTASLPFPSEQAIAERAATLEVDFS
jgi:hypothetical protein